GFGMDVYQSFHSSPSLTASVRTSRWACDNGSSRACGPASVTGSSQCIGVSSFRHCEPTGRANARSITGSAKQSRTTISRLDCLVATLLAMTISSIQKIQRQAGPLPLHRDEFALAGQRDVGGLQLRPAKGDIGC